MPKFEVRVKMLMTAALYIEAENAESAEAKALAEAIFPLKGEVVVEAVPAPIGK